MRFGRVIRAVLLSALLCVPSLSRARVPIADSEECPCTIQIQHVTSIGRSAPRAAPYPGSKLAVDSRGWYYVAWNTEPGAIAVYDSQGSLMHTIGKKGAGPGEFLFPLRTHITPHDSLFVFDREKRVITVLDPEGNFARGMYQSASISDMRFLSDDSIVAHFQLSSRTRGYPVHILERDGAIRRSFGAKEADILKPERVRRIAVTPQQTIWVGHHTEYLLEEYDTTGKVLRTLRRNVSWYPRQKEVNRRTLTAIEDLYYDAPNDRLWVLVHKADPNADLSKIGAHPTNERGESMARIYSVAERDELTDWYLEAIDLKTGKALATATVRSAGFFISRNGRLYTYKDDSSGAPYIDVWDLRLVPRRSS